MGGYPHIPLQAKVKIFPYLILFLVGWVALQGLNGTTPAAGSDSRPNLGASSAVSFALAQRGKPYRWGAEGPGAYDCSGLMWRAWQHAGVSIPRTAEGQRVGLPRVRGKLRPGDLVIYRTNGPSRRHVAMVVSKGRMVEAPARGVPVRKVALRAGWIAAVRPAGSVAKPARAAKADIPRRYLALYQRTGAGQTWQTRDGRRYAAWAVLAGIGKVESDHGRSRAPGVRSGVNRFGCCAGPMQFNLRNGPPSTWDAYGKGSPYRPEHAIPAARRLLVANGARRDLSSAIWNYNHSSAYVAEVKALARRYSKGKP